MIKNKSFRLFVTPQLHESHTEWEHQKAAYAALSQPFDDGFSLPVQLGQLVGWEMVRSIRLAWGTARISLLTITLA